MTDSALPRCRFCSAPLEHTFVDLGMSPLCERFLTVDELDRMEPFYPLHVRVCGACRLVQLPAYVPAEEIFTDYAYFSAYSDSWVEHARRYCEMAIERFGLGAASLVVELASNDGYLLQHMVERGVPALGIEPAENVALAARERGVETLVEFFGVETAARVAAERGRADLIVANNVLAHVPDLNDFVAGIGTLLGPHGVATLEFPHLLRLVDECQFDTIYHEHYSYLSLLTSSAVFEAHGMRVFDVEELPSHGGSLRLFVCHAADPRVVSEGVLALAAQERERGYEGLAPYAPFAERVAGVKRDLLEFLIAARRDGRTVAGYGAPGKGNTLLNYCGIRTDLLEYTVDRNPYKHGRFLPGTHIPVYPPDRIMESKPDFILILPWNLRREIQTQLEPTRSWGARCVVPIPGLQVLE